MKLVVLEWLWKWLLGKIAKIVEVTFRLILLCLPLGIFLLLIQSRSKVSSTSNLSVYTNGNSVWQHIFPGFMLVSVNKDGLRNYVTTINTNFQLFVQRNKYTLSFLAAASLVGLMLLMYIK